MPKTQCVVPGCLRRGGHRFPGTHRPGVRRSWMISIKRADKQGGVWKPSTSSVVCHSHFLPSDYISETTYDGTCLLRRLKETAVPSVFSWNVGKQRCRRKLQRSTTTTTPAESDTVVPEQAPPVTPDMGAELEITSSSKTELVSSSTQTDPDDSQRTEKIITVIKPVTFSVTKFMNDTKGIHFFTGLENYEKFMFVFNTLGPASSRLTYMYGPVTENIGILDRFFLVLMKLRRYSTNFELSRHFDISESDVYNIICTWIRYMSLQWKELNMWPSSDLVKFYSPSEFRRQYPTTRVIIDGTECPVKKPSFPVAQQSTFSSYKNRNTVKVLAGISPAGLCTYVSAAYGGSTSDRQIAERSNLTQLCESGDSIMADKGFDVQDIFAPYDVTINIPTFFSKKNRMSSKDVIRDRKIAAKRVHIERFIGLAKTYKILTQPLNASETILSSDIIFVCFMLCNFRNGIVPQNA